MQGYGGRIRQAMLELSVQLGRRVTLADFGALVGKVEAGRRKAYSATGVSEWLQERSEPSLAAFRAMSKVTGRPESWLAAFDESAPRVVITKEEGKPFQPAASRKRRASGHE